MPGGKCPAWPKWLLCRVPLLLLCGAGLGAAEWTEADGYRVRELRLPADPAGRGGFTAMPAAAAGVGFTNVLGADAFLTNFVAHNGSGVALGDIDGDGRIDLYFCGLESRNRLFRNLGEWKFQEVDAGDAACDGQFSTGAVLAEVDGDGDLDLLVNGIASGTRLFLNDGAGRWSEAKESGLSRTASGTTLALADIDGDGDLDIYSTHYIDVMHLADPTIRFALAKRGDGWAVLKVNGEPATLPRWKGRFEALPDGSVRELPEVHGLYRNDGKGRFTAIQDEPGMFRDEDGQAVAPYRDWGLAAMFRDLNGDGAPDLYVCNDNASPDRIWINSGQGTFRAIGRNSIRHGSRSAMAVDFADVNRDGQVDFLVTDMLAREPERRLTQLMRDRPDPAEVERSEARPAFNRNTLFWGRGDGTFAEVAWLAGVAATDWSWCPAFLDVDLDGYEDLLVTNGFDLDVMDQDSNDALRVRLRQMTEAQKKRSRRIHPPFRTRNAAFRNRGDGTFEPAPGGWGFDHEGVSHGMALGDLDGDGDLDVVVNHLNESPGLYRNDGAAPRIAVRLRGAGANPSGIGARLRLVGDGLEQSQEMICGGRYLSGDEAVRVFAAKQGDAGKARLEVLWRGGRRSELLGVEANRVYEVFEARAAPQVPRDEARNVVRPWFRESTNGLVHRHVEKAFDELARQPMLPRRLGRSGPGVAWVDWNGDGWEDVFIAASPGEAPAFFLNEDGKRFRRLEGVGMPPGETGSVVVWPDGTGGRSVLLASSTHERGGEVPGDLVRFPAGNPGKPIVRSLGAFCPGPLALGDIDGDGDLDLFVGGRFVPGRYPEPAPAQFWRNQGGQLELDPASSEAWKALGLVTGAVLADLDGDGDPDLVLATEWGPVRILVNQGGQFADRTRELGLEDWKGLWSGLAVGDFDGDGRLDLVAGNRGRNSHYEPHAGKLRLYYGDWDGNGQVDLAEAWGTGESWRPLRSRSSLASGWPELNSRYPTHAAFARTTIREMLGSRTNGTRHLDATTLETAVFLNRGGHFERRTLPVAAQIAPVFAVQVGDADGDGAEDVFLGQNLLGTLSDLSREDAGQGLWLRGRGDGTFVALDGVASGVRLDGEQRGAALADFNHDGRVDLVVTQNGGTTKLYVNEAARPGWRVVLAGSGLNPDGIGAHLRVVYSDGRRGPVREVVAGAGHGSQDSPAVVLGAGDGARALWVRWPGGREQVVPVGEGTREVRVGNTLPPEQATRGR